MWGREGMGEKIETKITAQIIEGIYMYTLINTFAYRHTFIHKHIYRPYRHTYKSLHLEQV